MGKAVSWRDSVITVESLRESDGDDAIRLFTERLVGAGLIANGEKILTDRDKIQIAQFVHDIRTTAYTIHEITKTMDPHGVALNVRAMVRDTQRLCNVADQVIAHVECIDARIDDIAEHMSKDSKWNSLMT